MQRCLLLCLCLTGAISCAHHNRVSGRALQGLTKNHEQFVLVFGSLSVSKGTLDHPAIHFLHQSNPSAPEYMLQSLTIESGDRFYAVLRKPRELQSLDEFTAEVGNAGTGFDKITYVRLSPSAAPLAMYVGEIRVSPADSRTAQGQKVVVKTNDDFENAVLELKRLYPHFDGTISKVALLRNLSPAAAPPERIRSK
jgi:hypothetical protein